MRRDDAQEFGVHGQTERAHWAPSSVWTDAGMGNSGYFVSLAYYLPAQFLLFPFPPIACINGTMGQLFSAPCNKIFKTGFASHYHSYVQI